SRDWSSDVCSSDLGPSSSPSLRDCCGCGCGCGFVLRFVGVVAAAFLLLGLDAAPNALVELGAHDGACEPASLALPFRAVLEPCLDLQHDGFGLVGVLLDPRGDESLLECGLFVGGA